MKAIFGQGVKLSRLAVLIGFVLLTNLFCVNAESAGNETFQESIKANNLLGLVSTVTVRATIKCFVVSDHFTVSNKEVKMYYIGEKFKRLFLDKVEEPQAEVVLRSSRLNRASLDMPIMAELGNQIETTLANVWQMLKGQPNGESGILMNNGKANIFYVRDAKGVLWAVSVDWGSGGWGVDADSVTDPYEWSEGGQVFSRHRTEA